MPRKKSKEQLKAELEHVKRLYDAEVAAEKSDKIKAQAKKRGQMLALIGLATIAFIQYIETNEDKNFYLDQLRSSFLTKYPPNADNLSEKQKEKRQKDDVLLCEALKLAKNGKLK